MATAEQLKALIRAYSKGDDSRFLSVTTQIAAHAARSGKRRLAAQLRELVEEARQAKAGVDPGALPVAIAQPRGELAGLVAASYPDTRLSDMVLAPGLAEQLARVIEETRQRSLLVSHGLPPRRKLLLVGPPGCGKSMTAAAIAGELNLPLLTVQFHVLITKFMGETAAKLNLIFTEMRKTRGVYLFDEFDAIGGQRAAANDVGEIGRVLNSFLTFLEQDHSESIIIAATNLVGVLDEALFRRFDDVLAYEPPSGAMYKRLILNRLAMFDTRQLDWGQVLKAADAQSHADVVKACEDAAKKAVLAARREIRSNDLVHALELRSSNKA